MNRTRVRGNMGLQYFLSDGAESQNQRNYLCRPQFAYRHNARMVWNASFRASGLGGRVSGNAAEHRSAIVKAAKNRIDVTLFHWLGNADRNVRCTGLGAILWVVSKADIFSLCFDLVVIILSVVIVNHVVGDGRKQLI